MRSIKKEFSLKKIQNLDKIAQKEMKISLVWRLSAKLLPLHRNTSIGVNRKLRKSNKQFLIFITKINFHLWCKVSANWDSHKPVLCARDAQIPDKNTFDFGLLNV